MFCRLYVGSVARRDYVTAVICDIIEADHVTTAFIERMAEIPGRTIVITGASDGVGAAAATRLAGAGEYVVVVGRTPSKTKTVAASLGADYYLADFADLRQVRRLAGELLDRYGRIDVLANNAGGTMAARETTADGYLKTFQVNYLAPFLLTTLLLDRLIASRASVLNTSSLANRFAWVDVDQPDGSTRFAALDYARTKLLNILFTKELHRRYHSAGISAAALHPGVVASNFSSDSGPGVFSLVMRGPLRRLLAVTPEQGANELVRLATTQPGLDWTSGEYYANHRIAKANRRAYDAALAEQLWDRSLDMVSRQH
jgi:NAD(P)-dependent dehydrogenase (short-subunit alcohol dehydrogenase family)